MENPEEKLIERLNHLIAICLDGKYGYETAAGKVSSPELKTLFQSFSESRSEFAETLKYEVQKAGGNPDKEADLREPCTEPGLILKSILPSKDRGILRSCITGDKAALTVYEEVLRDTLLPTEVRSHVNMQYVRIKEALKKLESLS